MMKKTALFFIVVSLFFSFISMASAYETIPFRNGGSIEGVVEYAGATVPKDPMLTLSSETEYCGQKMPAKKYLIKERKVKNAVVYLVGIKAGKAIPGETVTVTNVKCEFVPHVAVGFKGGKIIMKTDDPVFHTLDVHVSISGKELYHVALPEKGSSATKTISGKGLLELSCYVHPWQRAYVSVFDHPYAVVTDEKGKFAIKDIPPGIYTVEAWHEALGAKSIAGVNVESGKTSTIKVEYAEEKKSE